MRIFNSARRQRENFDQPVSGAPMDLSASDNSWEASNACAFTDNVRRMVRGRQMPLLVAGLGMAWMILAPRTANDRADRTYGDDGAQEFGYRYSSGASSEPQYDAASISEREGMKEHASSVARRTMTRAQEQSDRWRQTLRTMAYEQPLFLGAIGLAIGAAIGAMLPVSESEDRLLGPTRDQTIDRIKARSSEAYQQVRETATREMEGVKQAVSEIVSGKK